MNPPIDIMEIAKERYNAAFNNWYCAQAVQCSAEAAIINADAGYELRMAETDLTSVRLLARSLMTFKTLPPFPPEV